MKQKHATNPLYKQLHFFDALCCPSVFESQWHMHEFKFFKIAEIVWSILFFFNYLLIITTPCFPYGIHAL